MIRYTLLYLFGGMLYINYRLVYAFLIHKKVETFGVWTLSKELDRSVILVASVDIAVLAYVFFGLWWSLSIFTAITLLNVLVYLISRLIKRIWRTR